MARKPKTATEEPAVIDGKIDSDESTVAEKVKVAVIVYDKEWRIANGIQEA